MADVKPGDKVYYIPHKCHRLDESDKGLPWHYGKRTRHHGMQPVPAGEVKKILRSRNPDLIDSLVPLAPRRVWAATVLKVNDDGTLNLQIVTDRPGQIVCYKNLARDETGKTPHTWHVKPLSTVRPKSTREEVEGEIPLPVDTQPQVTDELDLEYVDQDDG